MTEEIRRAGMIAVIGRPNVGKSTLVNSLVGSKVSIVTAKPQTTRHRVMGVVTRDAAQMVFIDTPGIHEETPRRMNRMMNRAAETVAADADLVLFLVTAGEWGQAEERILAQLRELSVPVALVVNKVDRYRQKDELLPFLAEYDERMDFAFVVPLSALREQNLEALQQEIVKHLPESPPLFPPEQETDQSPRMLAAEVVREKLTERVHREVPYAVAVQVENLEEEGHLRRLQVIIWVEREGQKGIVIGDQGAVLKQIGTAARKELEARWDCRVHLDLWVKIRGGWPDDERILGEMGISPE